MLSGVVQFGPICIQRAEDDNIEISLR